MGKSRCCMRLKCNLFKNDIVSISPSVIFHHYVRYSNVLDSTNTNLYSCYIFETQIQPFEDQIGLLTCVLYFISFYYHRENSEQYATCLGRCCTRSNCNLFKNDIVSISHRVRLYILPPRKKWDIAMCHVFFFAWLNVPRASAGVLREQICNFLIADLP